MRLPKVPVGTTQLEPGIMNFFSFLTDEDIRYVHESSLEILEEVGLLVRNEKARKRFAEHGAIVDHETEMVRIPSAVVEKYRALRFASRASRRVIIES